MGAATGTTLPISALEPNDYNPNSMSDERFAELVEEVQHLGRLPKPVIARPNGDGRYVIVDGEHGWRAAGEAGLTDIAIEIVDADDFEARRQTYKRNQHGEHNPVLLGRMFRQMMEDREISQRALAAEIAVSEGTVRNALLYADAADMRNRYADSEGQDETPEAAASLIASLPIRSIRYYQRLPENIGNAWLDAGADVKALLGVQTDEAIEQTEYEAEDAPVNVGEYFERLEKSGLFEYVPKATTGEGFAKNIKTIEGWYRWERTWTWGTNSNRLTTKGLRPYTRHYFMGVFYVREADWMANALNVIINTNTQPPSFYLTPEEFQSTVDDCDLISRESSYDFVGRLELAVLNKHGDHRPTGTQGVRAELMEHAIDTDAPDYIQQSKLYLEQRYILWKSQGSEDAKRIVAEEQYISGAGDNKKQRVAAAIEQAERSIRANAKEQERLARYQNSSKDELATSLAERLFGEVYKDDPDAFSVATERLSQFEKLEIQALDEFVAEKRDFDAWLETFRVLAGIIS